MMRVLYLIIIFLLIEMAPAVAGTCPANNISTSCATKTQKTYSSTPSCTRGLNIWDEECNNSCVNLNQSVFTGVATWIASLGSYTIIDMSFDMLGCDQYCQPGYDMTGKGNYNPQGQVCFRYKSSDIGDPVNCQCLTAGSTTYADAGWVNFRVVDIADMVCVQAQMPLTGIWQTMGCKYKPAPKVSPLFDVGNLCSSCSSKLNRHSQSFFSVTGTVMECMRDTINKVFITGRCPVTTDVSQGDLNSAGNGSPIVWAQQGLKRAVLAALTLYVIFFGVRIALGQDMPRKSEIFMFIGKMVLVLYFSVGFKAGLSSTDSSYNTYNGLIQLLNLFQTVSSHLSNAILQSVNSTSGLCYYDANSSLYHPGGWDYSYLAIWDALDCRIAYYFGLNNPNMAIGYSVGLFGLIIPGMLTFQLMFSIFTLIFAVFLISFVVYFLNTYILCTLMMNLVALMGPFFIPMALFRVTKRFYDGWLKLLFGFALQPVIISAFLALVMGTFDQLFATDCCWSTTNTCDSGKSYTMWLLNDSGQTDACRNSPAWNMSTVLLGSNGTPTFQFDAVFFSITGIKSGVVVTLFKNMAAMTLCAFLFYHFSAMLSGFATDLAGGVNMGKNSIGPTAVFDGAAKLAKTAAKAYLTKGESLKDEAKEAAVSVAGRAGAGGDVSVSSNSSSQEEGKNDS